VNTSTSKGFERSLRGRGKLSGREDMGKKRRMTEETQQKPLCYIGDGGGKR
jgi:hypothetical protein